MKSNLFIVFPLIFFCFNSSALYDLNFPEIPSKNKPLSISLQKEFYRSVSNFIEFGQYDDLPDESYFQYFGFHPSISYSPLSHYINFELFANSFWAFSKKQGLKRDVFRVSFLGVGLNFYHKFKSLYSGFELRGGVPFSSYGNSQSPDEMIIGDGAYFVEPGLWLLFQPSKMLYIYYNLAFRYRMFSLSSPLFNRLGGVLQTRYIDLGLSMDSFLSVLSDEFTLQPKKRWKYLGNNAGSYKFFSVNPSALSFTAWMGFRIKPVFTKLYFNFDTFGKHYARGLKVGLITTFRWNTKSSIINRRKSDISFDFDEDIEISRPRRSTKKESYFEEEEDPYSKENINKELKEELKSLRY